jgi:hypothetical protein
LVLWVSSSASSTPSRFMSSCRNIPMPFREIG